MRLNRSKNTPDMLLRRGDIASFRADWNDKAGQYPRHRGRTEYRPGRAGVP